MRWKRSELGSGGPTLFFFSSPPSDPTFFTHQALYFCAPFRTAVLAHAASPTPSTDRDSLLAALGDLFASMAASLGRGGGRGSVIAPKRFVARLKRDNEAFRSFMHQDAHEFLNYLLNECAETVAKERAKEAERTGVATDGAPPPPTWVDDVFRGRLVCETKCLACEAVTLRDEPFFDLSLEVAPHVSLAACLRTFSAKETLGGDDKFRCDACGGALTEAERRLRVARVPRALVLHLKRFKYAADSDRLRKLGHRVVFPTRLKLGGVAARGKDGEEASTSAADVGLRLTAVVVHVGSGPNHGHYVAFVRPGGGGGADDDDDNAGWLLLDDDAVERAPASALAAAFGAAGAGGGAGGGGVDHGYILLYERVDGGGGGEE